MKILFLNDTSSSGNWGARATSYAMKHMLLKTGDHFLECVTEDQIKNNYKSKGAPSGKAKSVLKKIIPPLILELKNNLLVLETPSVFQNTPQNWDDYDKILKKVRDNEDILSKYLLKIRSADLVVIQGEGCIKGNTNHARMLLFAGYIAKKYFKKPTIIVNHTADFSHPVLNEIARNVYPVFDDIVFREPISARRCSEFCDGRIGADASFIFKSSKRSEWLPVANRPTYFNYWPDNAIFNPGNPYICIGGGSGLSSMEDERFNPVAKYSVLIEHLQNTLSHQLVLTASGSTDLKIFRSLAEKHSLPLIGLSVPVQQAVDILGNARAYIGGRWHPSLFGLSGGTPVIPIAANSFKMEALAELFSLSEAIFKPENIDSKSRKIVDLLRSYLSRGESLRIDLKNQARQEKKKIAKNVTYLKKITGELVGK